MRISVGLAMLLVACGAAPPPDEPLISEIDSVDRCTVLPRSCLGGFDYGDDDGCPDPPTPEIAFAHGDASLATDDAVRLVNDVGWEGRNLWPGATLRLVSVRAEGEPAELDAQRIAAVRAALTGAGTPEDRLREGGEPPPGTAVSSVRIAVDGCAL